MSKAIALFTTNSCERAPAQVAQSEAGQWFARSWAFNGYAKAWSAWAKIAAPTHPERLSNSTDMIESYGAAESYALTADERARTIISKHGVMRLASCSEHRLRLPDSPEEIEAKAIAKACRQSHRGAGQRPPTSSRSRAL